ncbi:DUF1707 domain-containing protein [Nocardioides sp. ChNu-153]|uniref:DUF1707 SHOCT-like domain-containing protein n=1 Tax=unclassified Nocardioides TaxID=2615069 RepID=UPI0024077136|nr:MULTISPECIES: DUF1707 domain-containing protein [unclassified Nocardioides]MDF9716193.1 DUF1707 domain-containing protein [Nocardioides sp. ChNu-99]MDN7121583.1 DUF1707 domain-containing protein [Nocardioides sp. ChNu-153]
MSEAGRVRLSDAERQDAAAALGTHFAEGRLDPVEHDERSTAVWAARFAEDLQPVFADLPAPHPGALAPARAHDWNAQRPAARKRGARGARGDGPPAFVPTAVLVALLVGGVLLGVAVLKVLVAVVPLLLLGGLAFLAVRRIAGRGAAGPRGTLPGRGGPPYRC